MSFELSPEEYRELYHVRQNLWPYMRDILGWDRALEIKYGSKFKAIECVKLTIRVLITPPVKPEVSLHDLLRGVESANEETPVFAVRSIEGVDASLPLDVHQISAHLMSSYDFRHDTADPNQPLIAVNVLKACESPKNLSWAWGTEAIWTPEASRL
jgi:hypothetical protein